MYTDVHCQINSLWEGPTADRAARGWPVFTNKFGVGLQPLDEEQDNARNWLAQWSELLICQFTLYNVAAKHSQTEMHQTSLLMTASSFTVWFVERRHNNKRVCTIDTWKRETETLKSETAHVTIVLLIVANMGTRTEIRDQWDGRGLGARGRGQNLWRGRGGDWDGTWICSMPFSGVYSPRPAVHGSPVPRWLLHHPHRMLPVVDGFVPPATISSSSHVIGRHAGPMTWNSLPDHPRDPTLSDNVFNGDAKTYRTRIERMRV